MSTHFFKNNYNITTETTPTTVLGCWVINHNFKGYKSKDKIEWQRLLREKKIIANGTMN